MHFNTNSCRLEPPGSWTGSVLFCRPFQVSFIRISRKASAAGAKPRCFLQRLPRSAAPRPGSVRGSASASGGGVSVFFSLPPPSSLISSSPPSVGALKGKGWARAPSARTPSRAVGLLRQKDPATNPSSAPNRTSPQRSVRIRDGPAGPDGLAELRAAMESGSRLYPSSILR